MVGGTGLYLQSVLSGYRMVKADPDPGLRAELSDLDDDQLNERLRSFQGKLHNVTDLTRRERTIRATKGIVAARPEETVESGADPEEE